MKLTLGWLREITENLPDDTPLSIRYYNHRWDDDEEGEVLGSHEVPDSLINTHTEEDGITKLYIIAVD